MTYITRIRRDIFFSCIFDECLIDHLISIERAARAPGNIVSSAAAYVRTRAGWKKRVAPEKRKCVGELRGRKREGKRDKETEREREGWKGWRSGKGL